MIKLQSKTLLLALHLFLWMFGGNAALAQKSEVNESALKEMAAAVPNLSLVTPWLIRGGQPSTLALNGLKKAGVRTIIDLRNEDAIVRREAGVAKALGLKFVNFPLDVFSKPSDQVIDSFLKTVDGPANQPVYVHCLHGQDRTGTMIAIYRIQHQGWSGDRAYQEMLACGFRPALVNLSGAVFDRAESLGRAGKRPPANAIVDDLKQRLSKYLSR
jgi:protein tyrosine/serine phosphatase